MPSPQPSIAPTTTPSSSPSLLPPPCAQDITVLKTNGLTEVDLGKAVRILNQDTSTVTVRLYQAWTAADAVDSIFYNYRENVFSDRCGEANTVHGGTHYEDITIHCYETKPVAELEICVMDNGDALSSNGDAAIPYQCCNTEVPDDSTIVCYHLLVNCKTVCVDAAVQ